jgi:YggT family protein
MSGIVMIRILDALIQFYSILIFAYVITSWFQSSAFVAEIREVLGTLVEPYLSIFRRLIPSLGAGGMGIDFSPIIALLALQIVGNALVNILRSALL